MSALKPCTVGIGAQTPFASCPRLPPRTRSVPVQCSFSLSYRTCGTTGTKLRLQPLLPKKLERKVVIQASQGGANAGEVDPDKQAWKFGRNEGPMPWQWKLLCAILYMLPWVDVQEKTVFLIERFPAFTWTYFFPEPFEHWFSLNEYTPLILFFATYLLIVRNKNIPHVARYHVMMGVMLDIIAMILLIVEDNLPLTFLWGPWSDLFYFCGFFFMFLLIIYCLFFCFLGWYCDIPLVSDGVYMQIEQAENLF